MESMDDTKSTLEEDDDLTFFDAFDEFPFFDCLDSFESSPKSQKSDKKPQNDVDSPITGDLLRRRSSERHRKLYGQTSDPQTTSESVSVVTTESKPEVVVMESNEEGSSLMVYVAELIVKAIGFQFNLLISSVTFPFWVLYYSCMLAVNPIGVIGIGKSFVIGKLMRVWGGVTDALSPFVSEWFKEHAPVLKLVLRCGWGLIWSVYVCSVLVSLLVSAFLVGGFVMRYWLVEEPFQLKQGLNFDYTKSRPAAFVPISVCPSVECGGESNEVGGVGGVRVIPPDHKLQATVTMLLPESDYNRNLGIFQVRVDFLSVNGKSLSSLSHPCMLEFRSEPIRLLLTSFKIIPLVAGYITESQTLKLKFRGYTEGVIPTACLKVTIEQRAEFRAGAGIPEVYDAFLHLESELPFLKRILWYWRKTIFVWLSMMVFVVELLFALVCCRPILIPGARTRTNNVTARRSPRNQAQR